MIPLNLLEDVSDEPAFDNVTSSSSHPQPSKQTREPYVIDEMFDHYKGELPCYASSSEKASEIAPDIAISEIP